MTSDKIFDAIRSIDYGIYYNLSMDKVITHFNQYMGKIKCPITLRVENLELIYHSSISSLCGEFGVNIIDVPHKYRFIYTIKYDHDMNENSIYFELKYNSRDLYTGDEEEKLKFIYKDIL